MQSRDTEDETGTPRLYVLRVRSAGDSTGTWGDWLSARMRARGFNTDEALARRIGVDNATISRWRTNKMTPDIPKLRQLVEPLRTDLMTLLVAAGLLTEREAGGQAGRVDPPTARELLEHDPELPELGRKIVLAAYDAAANEGRPGLRAVARRPRKGQT